MDCRWCLGTLSSLSAYGLRLAACGRFTNALAADSVKPDMLHVERVFMPGPYRFFDHRHDADHMLVVLSGAVVEDGATYGAGDVRFSSAADRHFLTFAPATSCLVVAGDVPPLGCGTRRIGRLDLDAVDHFAACSGARLVDRVASWVASGAVRDLAMREVPSWLAEFEDVRVAGRLVNAKTIDIAARIAGVSREHLARSYRRHFGHSVTDAIKARRLHAAWDAITQSSLALAEVAGTSGFADQSHMTRHFTEWIGLTPAAVRRIARQVTRLQDGTLAVGV
jgi:AraC-like DNA-binding protein